MKRCGRGLGVAAASLLFASMYMPEAKAGCGDIAIAHKTSWSVQPGGRSGLLQRVSTLADNYTVVGMWNTKFLVGDQVIDFGYAVWHGDGTEFLNSATHAPSTQNYCLGVWKKTGWFTYRLNHWALSYTPAGKYVANVNIRESVTLARGGKVYSGTFTIDAYDAVTGARLGAQTAGTVFGSRVTVD